MSLKTILVTTMAIGTLILTGCSKDKEVETVTVTEVEASGSTMPMAASDALDSSAPVALEVVEIETSVPTAKSN